MSTEPTPPSPKKTSSLVLVLIVVGVLFLVTIPCCLLGGLGTWFFHASESRPAPSEQIGPAPVPATPD
jgi:hypothetical protein